MLFESIGPVWDGNEVWLLTAGGATFAAFPNWYATLFSGFYLALFLILVALSLAGAWLAKVVLPILPGPARRRRSAPASGSDDER